MSNILRMMMLGVAACACAGSAAQAAPVPTSMRLIEQAMADKTTPVYWRGRRGWGYRHGWGFGLGWGPGWPPYYYGGGIAAPYYYAPYYAPPIVYETAPPVYIAPEPAPAPRSGAVRQCWIDTDSLRGYGYWRPC